MTGIQGSYDNATQKDPQYMQAGACCKHYVSYDLEGNGGLPSRVFFDANVDTRSFWEVGGTGLFPGGACCSVLCG